VGDPAAEVRAHLLLGGSSRAAGVGRPRGDVLGDGPAFGLVSVEQLRPGPVAEHPAEPPADVVAVVQRDVEPHPAARRDAVCGVAGQEDAAAAPALRELRGG